MTTSRGGGAAPYGYKRSGGGFEVDPQEAPIRKLIFQLFLKHRRKLTVAKELNKQGYRTRSGAKFSDSSVDRFLRDPIVIGHHKSNFVPASGSKQYTVLKPESEWRFASLEPIIEKQMWQQVQDILYGQKKKPLTKKSASVFADYIFCACGGKMHRPYKRRSYNCSHCSNSIEAETLSAIFGKKLEGYRVDDKLLRKIFPQKSASAEHKESQRVLLAQQKSKVEQELEKLYDLFMSNAISKQRFEKKNKPLEARLAELNAGIADLDSDQQLDDTVKDLGTLWTLQTDKAKRQIVIALTHRIEVDSTQIKIAFLFPPS